MKWIINTAGEQLSLDPRQLLDLLLGHIVGKQKKDQEHLSEALVTYLQQTGALAELSLLQLCYTAFLAGYYYRVFLQKNKVEIKENDVPNPSEGSQ